MPVAPPSFSPASSEHFLSPSATQRRLLDLIRRHGPVSRAELTPLSGLTPGAISRLVKELIAAKRVQERERRQGERGQPALPLEICPEGGVALGLAFCYGRLDAVLLDYTGQPMATASAPFEGRSDQALRAGFQPLLDCAKDWIGDAGLRLCGIGLSLPGHRLSREDNEIAPPETVGWLQSGSLATWLSENFQTIVFIDNIANTAAISALYHGLTNEAQSTLRDLVTINLGHGIGCGLILDGAVYQGGMGFAGEVGRLYPAQLPRPSARDLLITLRSAGRDLLSIDDLCHFLPQNEPIVEAWVERASSQLFELVRLIHLLIAPQRILLSGMLPDATIAALAERLQRYHVSDMADGSMPLTSISAIPDGMLASAIGSAWLPLMAESQLFGPS